MQPPMERRTKVRIVSVILVLAAVAGARELWFRFALSHAQSLLERGDPASAEHAFEQALTIKSGSVNALIGRAAARERSNDRRGALVLLRDAVAHHPAEPRLHLELARALAREGATGPPDRQRSLYGEAAMTYKQAAALRPDDAEILNDIGLGLRSIGQTDLAIATFRKAAAIDPEWGGPEVNLGDTLRDAERYQEALDILRTLESRTVKVAAYRIQNALAQVYLDLQKPREAEQALRRAVALNPQYSPVRISLALALVDQRRYSDATTELEVANRLDPQSDTIFLMCQLYALQKRAEDVLRCLGQAIPAGTPADTIRKDPIFQFVRERSEYDRLIGSARAR
jgi:tetratricopeptide (TPR) repeat protein